jgi:ubiquinone/menaquinone biosynthesis C-methylase UbiE
VDKKFVIEGFSCKKAQERYAKDALKGLWGAEEILVKRFFPKGCKMLDIGCGTGRTTLPLHKMGYDIVGVDITPAMIKMAKGIARKKKLKIKYEVGDATKLRFKAKTFDAVIFSFNGIMQIPCRAERQKAFDEIARVLKPGGHFIFSTHWRKIGGLTVWGVKNVFKHCVKKPFGFPVREPEFGDVFFVVDGRREQYIHIPSCREVRAYLKKAAFSSVLQKKAAKISTKNLLGNAPPMMWVAKK